MPTNKNTIRRNYLTIRRIMKGDYPSRETLFDYLREHGVADISPRTFMRDIADIRSNFDVELVYDKGQKGWMIDQQGTGELGKLLDFIGLAETSDIVLHSIKNKQELLKYLSVSPTTIFRGLEHIGTLLQAVCNQKTVSFAHLNYTTGKTTDYTAEPYLLKEFDGRWYLFAYVRSKGEFRTFGLDRISNLIVNDKKYKYDKAAADIVQKFDNVYGLIFAPDQNKNAPIETVKLRFAGNTIKHLEALPLHHSQEVEGNTVSLQVIINPELENKILSYGENVEVLLPHSLRDKIRHRLSKAIAMY